MINNKNIELIFQDIKYPDPVNVNQCWQWSGSFINNVPVVSIQSEYSSNIKTVRNLLSLLIYNQNTRIHGNCCHNSYCVNPSHFILEKPLDTAIALEYLDITHTDLAKQLGITRMTLHRWQQRKIIATSKEKYYQLLSKISLY